LTSSCQAAINTASGQCKYWLKHTAVFAAPPLYREDSNSDRTPAQAYDDRPARARGSYTGNDDDPPTLPEPVAAPRARPDQPPAPPKGTFCPCCLGLPACLCHGVIQPACPHHCLSTSHDASARWLVDRYCIYVYLCVRDKHYLCVYSSRG